MKNFFNIRITHNFYVSNIVEILIILFVILTILSIAENWEKIVQRIEIALMDMAWKGVKIACLFMTVKIFIKRVFARPNLTAKEEAEVSRNVFDSNPWEEEEEYLFV